MKKILCIFISMFIFINVNALEINSKNAVLYNLNDDKIVYEKNKDEKTSIASLTKIMTTLVAIEHIEDFNKTVTISNSMFIGLAEEGAAVVGLKDKEKVTYNDLLYGVFLPSGADAARALTISIAGDEENFVKLMNEKAKELNLENTHFSNTTGLDKENNYSNANDVALLLKEALKNDKFKELFTSSTYTFSNKSRVVYSTMRNTAFKYNYNIDYIEGGKTGYTLDAGRCLASLALDNKNNIEYLLVTINAKESETDAYHIKDAVNIYKHYFNNYKYHNLVSKDDLIVTLPTKYSKKKNVEFYAENDVKMYLENSKFDKNNVKLKYNGIDKITSNMKIGEKVGEVEVLYNDKLYDKITVVLKEKIDFSLIEFIKGNMKVIIVGALGVLALVFVKLFIRKK